MTGARMRYSERAHPENRYRFVIRTVFPESANDERFGIFKIFGPCPILVEKKESALSPRLPKVV